MNLEVTHLFESRHGAWHLEVTVRGHDLGELVHGGLGEVEVLIQETSTDLTSSSFVWVLVMVTEGQLKLNRHLLSSITRGWTS